jgi:hypothetical protein
MKKSHNNKHHRFHVYDDLFDRQIKTLHDEIWFESIIESYIDLDSHILRNRVEFISNFSKNVKIDRFRKNQKIEKNASTLSCSSSTREIDEYVCEIQEFLLSMMKKIVFWTIFNWYVKFFWIKKCNDAVKNIRWFKRRWSFTQSLNDWSKYMKTNNQKQKIIQKVKKINFRQELKRRSTFLWICDD